MKDIEPIYQDLRSYLYHKLDDQEWVYIKKCLLQANLEGHIAGMLEVMDIKSK